MVMAVPAPAPAKVGYFWITTKTKDMEQENFKSIDAVSRIFEMSQLWLHQLRICGFVGTRFSRNGKGKPVALYNVDDVHEWIEGHRETYQTRKGMGEYNKVTKTTVAAVE
jgi:hypothetical protein